MCPDLRSGATAGGAVSAMRVPWSTLLMPRRLMVMANRQRRRRGLVARRLAGGRARAWRPGARTAGQGWGRSGPAGGPALWRRMEEVVLQHQHSPEPFLAALHPVFDCSSSLKQRLTNKLGKNIIFFRISFVSKVCFSVEDLAYFLK